MAACQSIGNDCRTFYHNLDDWQIKRGTGLSAGHPHVTIGQHSGAGRPFLIHDQHIADIQPREQIFTGFTVSDLVYE